MYKGHNVLNSGSGVKQMWVSILTLLCKSCVCVCVCVCSVTQLCLTLCNPMNYSLPGSSVYEISQVRILEWVAISSSRGSS